MLVPLPVADVVSTPVETVVPAASVTEAARRLAEREVGSLVVRSDGRVVGIVTESDAVVLVSDAVDDAADADGGAAQLQ